MITWENYEEYLMLHADGELRPDEEQELTAFVGKHPELKKELAAYERTRLAPDTTQVFVDKDLLLKQVNDRKTIAFSQWRRYSIAAGVTALIFISLFKYIHNDDHVPELVKTDTVKQRINPVVVPPAVAKNTTHDQNRSVTTKKDTEKVKLVIHPVIHKETRLAGVQKVNIEHKKRNEVEHVQLPKQDILAIGELSLAVTKEMPHNDNTMQSPALKDVPEFAMPGNTEVTRKTFWDKLPIDDIKKRQMENIAGTIADVYDDVSAAKQNLYDKSITIDVKVQKRKLIISF